MRYDAGDFSSPIRTPNGYLRCDARITRVGVFEYRFADGSIRRELRLPSEVFKADSLQSFEDVPLTNNHPGEPLTTKNTRRYQAGNVKNVRQDREHIAARVLITDGDTIQAAEGGKTQLSCGYNCDMEERPGVTCGIDGVPDGLRYDAIQRNIIGNHVAIVDKARAGTSASLHLDGADAVMLEPAEPTNAHKPTGPVPDPSGGKLMKVRIDDVDFEMDESAGQAVGKVLARLDESGLKLAAAEKESSESKARADQATEALETEKKARADATSPHIVRDAVKARVALETVAAKVLAGGPELKLDELTEDDIKRAVVLHVAPGAKEKLEAGDSAYLSARFDAAVETWKAELEAKPTASHAVRGAAAPGATRADSATSRTKMIEDNVNMGQAPIRPSTLNV